MQFPTIYPILTEGWRATPNNGAIQMRADDGTLRQQILWSKIHWDFRFRILVKAPTDINAVMQFYRSYMTQKIDWFNPRDGFMYVVEYTAAPVEIEVQGLWGKMEIQFSGVRK